MPPRASLIDYDHESDDMAGAPRWALAMARDHALMRQTLGAMGEDGKSGTGLVGAVVELKTEMAGLLNLKNRGVGMIAGAFLVVILVTLGIKGAITALIGKG